MVLQDLPEPAWLRFGAPDEDVVVSSRCRIARTLNGHPFTHKADEDQLIAIQSKIESCEAIKDYTKIGKLSRAERDYYLSCRMISPGFKLGSPGRTLLLDQEMKTSIMVNEEDHLRLQVLTPGFTIDEAEETVEEIAASLRGELDYLKDPEIGWLTASPFNAGQGRRRSVLVHLIALAHLGRIADVMKALQAYNITARGLFGESTKALGALFQISTITGKAQELRGAASYLIEEERKARAELHPAEISRKTYKAAEKAMGAKELSLEDALRLFAWVRWSRAVDAPGWKGSCREVDAWTAQMEVFGTHKVELAARHRAEFVRARLA
jgi:protein arginine kinase